MRLNRTYGVWIAFAATGVLVVLLFFYSLYAYSAQKHNYQMLEKLHQMMQLDTQLDSFLARKVNFTDYDEIVAQTVAFDRLLEDFSESGKYRDIREDEILPSILEVAQKFEAKKELIEEYKSQSSVVNNSMMYIYDISAQLNHLHAAKDGALIHSVLEDINKIVFELSKISMEKKIDMELIGRLLASLDTVYMPDKETHVLVESLKKHCIVILEKTNDLENIITESGKHELKSAIGSLRAVLVQKFQLSARAEHMITIALFSTIVALFIVLAWLYRKEERIAKQLRDLNESLQVRIADEVAKSREKDMIVIKQSRLAAMGEMIGNIAHQWRQPLNAIGIIVQDLREARKYGELTHEYLEESIATVMESLNFMSGTIEDFRNFFKPDKQASAFNLNERVNDALSIMSASLKYAHIETTLVEDVKDAEVYGFANEFKQAVLAILSNAKDALSENDVKVKQIQIVISRENGHVYVKITDNAGGISDDIIDRIFEPYFTTKEQGKGTGIGLYMAKAIIENNMGGKLSVRNDRDGAQFLIELS